MEERRVRPGSRADRRRKDQGPPQGGDRRGLETPPVDMKWENEPEGIVFRLANPLVVSNCFALRDRLVGYSDRFSARRFTIDLSGVPYVDTAGAGVLMELKGRRLRDRKELIVCNPTPRVREILELLQLDRRLLAEQ